MWKKKLPTKTLTDWSHKSSGWQNIEKMATEMQSHGHSSLLRKVAGVGLFAAEAHFHPSCYHNSTGNINHLQDIINRKMQRQSKTKKWCWKHMLQHILKQNPSFRSRNIIDHKVLPLPVLLEQNQPHNDFRSEKLKKKSEKDPDILELMVFSKIEWKGCVSFWLIFNSYQCRKIPTAQKYQL